MPFALPDLPFATDALAPHISAETFDYHHGKHHQAYVDKTNELVADKGLEGRSLVELIIDQKDAEERMLFNNAAQVWNHSFYWQCLSPIAQKPAGRLAEMIAADFGSLDAMVAEMAETAVAQFGSGWAWLVLDGTTLKITKTHDADTPVAQGIAPLLTLDVWEHAYYIDYRSARPDYAKTVLGQCVNWAFVETNLDGLGAVRADQPG